MQYSVSLQSARLDSKVDCLLAAMWSLRLLVQVTKVSPTATNARIMCCAGQALDADFTGVIRQQDVRAHEVDKVGGGVLGKGVGLSSHIVCLAGLIVLGRLDGCRTAAGRVISQGIARSGPSALVKFAAQRCACRGARP